MYAMNELGARREEKEIPFRAEALEDPTELAAICHRHSVQIRKDPGHFSLVLTERSTDLVEFATRILNSGAVRIPDSKFGAYFRDLSTLEVP
jgi:hypothetical protein